MHKHSYDLVSAFRRSFIPKSSRVKVLDVGGRKTHSTDLSYRDIFCNDEYTCFDTEVGENVDTVIWPQDTYEVVVCGQVLEHVEDIFELTKRIGEVLKPGGWVVLVAPAYHKYHRYPIDCWRVLPDGMRYLLKLAGCEPVEVELYKESKTNWDCLGIGRKLSQPEHGEIL